MSSLFSKMEKLAIGTIVVFMAYLVILSLLVLFSLLASYPLAAIMFVVTLVLGYLVGDIMKKEGF